MDLDLRGSVGIGGGHGSSQAEEGRNDDDGAVHVEKVMKSCFDCFDCCCSL